VRVSVENLYRTVSLDTNGTAVLELLPRLGPGAYRLEGEFQVVGQDGCAGLYAGGRTIEIEGGEVFICASVAFRDGAVGPGLVQSANRAVVSRPGKIQKLHNQFLERRELPRPDKLGWRRVAIVVSVRGCQFFHGDAAAGQSGARLDDLHKELFFLDVRPTAPVGTIPFDGTGSVGVFVTGAEVFVRNVRVSVVSQP
jgi:hypothetical protein